MINNRAEGSPVNVVVADHDTQWIMQVTQELSRHPQIKVIGFAQTGQAVVDRAVSMAADAILVEYAMPDLTAAEVARRLAEQSPGTAVFAVTASVSAQLVMSAKALGVVEVFLKDGFVPREAADRIAGHVDGLRREWASVASRYGIVDRGSGPMGVKTVREVVTRPLTQTIILTHSPKGGVGKSTIAVNLATAIKTSPVFSGMRVALLDFDVDFGNLAILCHLPKNAVWNRNLVTWEHVPEDMSPAEVDDLMIPTSSGVMVVPAPLTPVSAGRVTLDLADKMLRVLRKYYGVIVIDGGPKINAAVDAAIHHATHVLMVSDCEGQGAENLARVVQFLSPDPDFPEKPDMSHLLRKMSLVVNRVRKVRGDLTSGEVARIVGRPVIAEVPEDESVRVALHSGKGKTAVEMVPDGSFALAIKSLANDLTGAYPQGRTVGATQEHRCKLRLFGRRRR